MRSISKIAVLLLIALITFSTLSCYIFRTDVELKIKNESEVNISEITWRLSDEIIQSKNQIEAELEPGESVIFLIVPEEHVFTIMFATGEKLQKTIDAAGMDYLTLNVAISEAE